MKKKINKFNLFIDIGAHKGESIELFSKNFFIKKIISFESSSVNFNFLKNEIEKNKKKYVNTEIILENIALGAENKLIDFYQFDESSSSTFKLVDTQSNYYKRKFRLLNFFGGGAFVVHGGPSTPASLLGALESRGSCWRRRWDRRRRQQRSRI